MHYSPYLHDIKSTSSPDKFDDSRHKTYATTVALSYSFRTKAQQNSQLLLHRRSIILNQCLLSGFFIRMHTVVKRCYRLPHVVGCMPLYALYFIPFICVFIFLSSATIGFGDHRTELNQNLYVKNLGRPRSLKSGLKSYLFWTFSHDFAT